MAFDKHVVYQKNKFKESYSFINIALPYFAFNHFSKSLRSMPLFGEADVVRSERVAMTVNVLQQLSVGYHC